MALPRGLTFFERGWLSSNSVLIQSSAGAVLVDSGYCAHAAQTVALIESRLRSAPLTLLLNTHLHSDHCGGNAALQSRYPALETRVPPGLARHVEQWDPVALSFVPTGQECPAFSIQGVLEPGSEVSLGEARWQVHAAPGHDEHSVVLFEPSSRTLLSADALWENGFGVIFQELEGESAFDEVAATLDMIETLAPTTVIPGHGRVFENAGAALSAARRRLDSFVRDPLKHARHAAKVLLKFKLLEQQHLKMETFATWAHTTPYFAMVHSRWFSQMPFEQWIDELADDLVRSGAASRHGSVLVNA
jgi:glyoxylase-like metal-dependent hydrolase (beta-lactamase superfamily II)